METVKDNLTNVSIVERFRLNDTTSEKETYHIVLSLKDLSYGVGDCVGIYPSNPINLVNLILKKLRANGHEEVLDRDGVPFSLKDFLTARANLSRIQRKLLELLKTKTDSQDLPFHLLDPTKKEDLRTFVEKTDLSTLVSELDFLPLTPQEFASCLSPLIPRLYSIASSMKEVGPYIHLTVALTRYEKEGKELLGTCSSYLCHQAPLDRDVVPIYIHKAKDFSITETMREKPIIMVGPGTGVAPFRGFMQERAKDESSKNWLFFGERHRKGDFYYKDFWENLVAKGKLQIDLAFSRDQKEKVYVQHKMLEKAKELWQWLEEGAYFFVCGDASKMAKDVDETLHKIVEREGKMSLDEAKSYIKKLRKEKRYLRDVY